MTTPETSRDIVRLCREHGKEVPTGSKKGLVKDGDGYARVSLFTIEDMWSVSWLSSTDPLVNKWIDTVQEWHKKKLNPSEAFGRLVIKKLEEMK